MNLEQSLVRDRRDFFRLVAGIPVGLVVGAGLSEISRPLETGAHDVTGLNVGNASQQNEIHLKCGPTPSQSCAANTLSAQKTDALYKGPLAEEIFFRAIPSTGRDMITEPDTDFIEALQNTIRGRQHVPMTRGEFLTGAITSLIFGFYHNITYSKNRYGFSTNTLPVIQTIGGGALWALQRKFGFFSNLAAHSFFNFRWMNNPN